MVTLKSPQIRMFPSCFNTRTIAAAQSANETGVTMSSLTRLSSCSSILAFRAYGRDLVELLYRHESLL